MTLQRKTITVTKQQENWIKIQINSGHYNNDSEYIRDLIRKDHDYKVKLQTLRRALIEGEDSGISGTNMADILKNAEKRHKILQS